MSSPVILIAVAFRIVRSACDGGSGGGYSRDWIDLAQSRVKWQAAVKRLVP